MCFGPAPKRQSLTHQPRGRYSFYRQDAVNIMDELALREAEVISPTVLSLIRHWRNSNSGIIRDFAHAGGPDIRIHITVQDYSQSLTFHIPVEWDGQWRIYEIRDITW